MNHQFKPGDLALIINASIPENLGRVVELQWATKEVRYSLMHEGVEQIMENPEGLEVWFLHGELIRAEIRSGKKYPSNFGMAPTRNLMPLIGDFASEGKKSRELVK
jgi:hypothetical protein